MEAVYISSTAPEPDPSDQHQSHLLITFFESRTGHWLYTAVFYVLCPLAMLLGMATNLVNLIVFIRGKLTDGMTLVFAGLALSDFFYNALSLISRLFNALHSVFKVYPYINLIDLAYVVTKYKEVWFLVSMLLTVFAAVQKCACIAIPLSFRSFFSYRKCAVGVVIIYIVGIAYNIPFLSVDHFAPYFDKRTNRTRLGYTFRTSRKFESQMRHLVGCTDRIGVPFVAQGLVIFCVLTMTIKLQAAAVSRREMTNSASEARQPTTGSELTSRKQQSNKSVLSTRELRVIRYTNILCAIFLAGMTPTTVFEACAIAYPDDFNDKGPFSAVFFFTAGIRQLLIVLSMAANIFIYYCYNSKYRATFRSMFPCVTADTSATGEN